MKCTCNLHRITRKMISSIVHNLTDAMEFRLGAKNKSYRETADIHLHAIRELMRQLTLNIADFVSVNSGSYALPYKGCMQDVISSFFELSHALQDYEHRLGSWEDKDAIYPLKCWAHKILRMCREECNGSAD